jgi:hypothetical protein
MLYQEENQNCYAYDTLIVCAKDEHEAKNIHPEIKNDKQKRQ